MTTGLNRFRLTAIAIILALSGLNALHGTASAASMAVELACASDYYAYCSKHDPDSAAARNCMNANGTRLSQRCINALVRAGEVSKAEIDRRASRTR